MLSLIGSLLGFGTSFLPKILGYFEDKRDQAHELSMMDKQLEQRIQLGAQKLQIMNVQADISEIEVLHKEHATITQKSAQWCINLSSSVRPVITYLIFAEFVVLTGLRATNYIDDAAYMMIWSSETELLWSAIVCFWFGQRTFNRK